MNNQEPPVHVLVVEDEAPIREGLIDLLSMHGFTVDTAGDGKTALEFITKNRYSLIVLDIMIPPPNGLEVLSTLRAKGNTTAVLMLTARGSESDVVEGLERGADDYVTKPFSVKELVARIRGLLRRTSGSPVEKQNRIALGQIVIDFDKAKIEHSQGTPIELTTREVMLLSFLYSNRQRLVGRAELLVHVWGYRDGVNIETRTIDVHVQKLRKKLRDAGGNENWIETQRGMGYRLVVE